MSLSTPHSISHSTTPDTPRGVYVPDRQDRHGQAFQPGTIGVYTKVSTDDAQGGMYVFEHQDMGKGGPYRHIHFGQDEWFYVVQGEFAFEVGNETFYLTQGDSIFAPRGIPHGWAHLGDSGGRMVILVQPAGTLETFFEKASQFSEGLTRADWEALFAAHNMQVVGDPLEVE